MFTGIVEELGKVKNLKRGAAISILEIEADKALEGVKTGDSVSVNGACLTITKKDKNTLQFDVMNETLKKSNLGDLKFNEPVNLERALKTGDRVSGHFVTGHIDCVGVIRDKRHIEGNLVFEIAPPAKFMPLIAPKGSVCVEGVSLTVVDKKSGSFTVYMIPHTLKSTTLGLKGHSAKVNLEFDILAKYASTALC